MKDSACMFLAILSEIPLTSANDVDMLNSKLALSHLAHGHVMITI